MLQSGDLAGCAFDLLSDLWVVYKTQYVHLCLPIILFLFFNILCIRLHQILLCILLKKEMLVEINDACANPGTICASVIWFGSHGVYVMLLPFEIVMLIGLSVTCKFVTGAPSTRKWPVAPDTEMAYSTARLSLSTLAVFVPFWK